MPDIPEPAFETPFEGADTVSAPSKATIPEEVRAAAEAMQEEEDTRTYPSNLTLARIALEAAEPIRAQREQEIRAGERRKVAEQIAAAILAVEPVEWALAGQHAGQDAATIARQIGEGRADT